MICGTRIQNLNIFIKIGIFEILDITCDIRILILMINKDITNLVDLTLIIGIVNIFQKV